MSVRYGVILILSVLIVGCGSPTAPSGPAVTALTVRGDTGNTGVTYNNNPALPAQSTQSLTATAQFADGTSRAVTSEATWTSSNTAIASVSSGTVSVNRRINGSATITATFRGATGVFQVTVAVL